MHASSLLVAVVSIVAMYACEARSEPTKSRPSVAANNPLFMAAMKGDLAEVKRQLKAVGTSTSAWRADSRL